MPVAEPTLPKATDNPVDGIEGSFEQVVSRAEAETLLERESRVQLANVVRGYFIGSADDTVRYSWTTNHRPGPTLVSLNWGLADDTFREFSVCVQAWESETRFLSSTTALVTNPAYLRIVGMGERVLPYLLVELRERPNYWFWALEAITGTDPASSDDDFDTRVSKWLRWGERLGLLRARD
jgi:hypothetical protein